MSEETDSLNEITQCVDMRDEDRDTDEEEEQEDDVGARCVTVSKSKGSLEESGDRYESLGTALEEEESPSRPPCPPRPPCPCVVGCAKASKDEMLNLKKDLFLNISAVLSGISLHFAKQMEEVRQSISDRNSRLISLEQQNLALAKEIELLKQRR